MSLTGVLVPLTSIPGDAVLLTVLERHGPLAFGIALLYAKLCRLEENVKEKTRRLDRLTDDVESNSSIIYDRLLGEDTEH